ncbi:hypothetical protein DB347_01740 [Opitutaceae bacterium EW11]|nr:hypothetical protein DB347_01740 [Opitutaceae bacterium EW11]
MSTPPESEPWTHAEMVAAARHGLLDELGIGPGPFAEGFLEQPTGPRVRAGGVRTSLARYAIDVLRRAGTEVEFGSFVEAGNDLVVHSPASLEVRPGLVLPVRTAIRVPYEAFVRDIAETGPAALDHWRPKEPLDVRHAAERLRASPPNFAGWNRLEPDDVAQAFLPEPPLVSDRKDFYRRIQLACSHAADRTLLDELAEQNPGFLDYLQCFPLARSMKRRVVAWLGPTNSGKTHRAVAELVRAGSGMYLGPLRLLALEQRDRISDLGRPCSLITGEERDLQSATHSSRTVEMADFSRVVDVCILDEMQLSFDRERGWAWVAAYCGVAAETLYVTGPVSTEPVVRKLAELCGDAVEVHHLERQGTLAYEGVLDWHHVPPRSAVIGFSRAMVLELKAMFESRGLRVSILYGGLSPEVRRNEARRFREGESDIVCATDAIGLGLNLPLDRVIFYETDKFDGETMRPLNRAEILQIGGRAGRGPGSTGWVAAFSSRDGRRIETAMAQPQATPEPDQLPAAPTTMHVRAIADHLGLDRLQPILDFFRTRLTFPVGTFFPDVRETVFAAAELVDTYAPSLPIEERYALACTPVDLDEHAARNAFAEWLEALETGRPATFPRQLESGEGLEALEEMLQLVTVYRWLALKFPDTFTDLRRVEQLRRDGIEQTQAILRRSWGKYGLKRRECAHCGRAILPSSPHRTCRDCYQEGYA